MSHSHDTNHSDKGIAFGLVLNSAYTAVEFVFGIMTGSLALIADASHNLTDTFTLAVSYVANRIARRRANTQKTFGYGRATILAALLNAVVMIGVASFIIIEAIERLNNPIKVEGGIVAIVASVGIVVNGSIAYILSKRRQDLNMRSAFIDMAFDALSSLGAVIAGLVMLFTSALYVDSIVGLLIAGLLLYNTFKIILEAVQILLEGTPKGINLDTIQTSICNDKDVKAVDDMHVWTIRSGYNALSCHIMIEANQLVNSRMVVERIKDKLRQDFSINHATIEVELEESTKHKHHEQH